MMQSKWIDRLADYSDESILNELRRVAKSLGKNTLVAGDLKSARLSYALLKKRFGGLHKALKLAGLDSPEFHRNVPDEDLLRELERVWDSVLEKEGRRPTKEDLAKCGAMYSYGPYYRRWRSWVKACEALLEWSDRRSQSNGQQSSAVSSNPDNHPKRYKRPIPLRLRYEILKRDEFKCKICGRSPANTSGLALQVDHVTAESKDGPTTPENLRTLCNECNLGRGNLD